jgi:thiopurine S-methyltransferase
MQTSDWLARWEEGRIGFHQEEPNPWLVEHAPLLWPRPSRILVPLCGKSRDLEWLAQRGQRVVGVELAERALRAFFAESGRTCDVREEAAGLCFRDGPLELWCADFFDPRLELGEPFDGIYDRAAWIALAPEQRTAYAARLSQSLRPGGTLLLVTIEYDQAEMEGPPFSIPEAEVRRALEPGFALELLARREAIEENPRLRERGLKRVAEVGWRARRS